MDYKQAAREWQQGTVRPVYLLYGTESYIMKEWLDLLVHSAIEAETKDFALSNYDLTETPLEAVLEDAETLPFLSPRKLVIASNAHFLTGGRDPSKADHKGEALQAYLANPAEHAVLVLTVTADKLDERKKIVKALKTSAVALQFAPLQGAELPQWVGKKAAGFGVGIEESAVEGLLTRVGGSCAALASEIEKLALYVGKGQTIRREHVEKLAIRTSEHNVFLLVEEIAKLQPERAMNVLHDLLREKEEPIKLLALIARQFRMMLVTKDLTGQGFSQSQIASQLGAHPYAIKIAGEQGRRFRRETLERIMKELADLDVAMKTGAVDKTFGLELFILRLGAEAQAAKAGS